jgi:hypothetical protein
VPIVLGRGERLWDGLEGLDDRFQIEAVTSPSGVTHLTLSRRQRPAAGQGGAPAKAVQHLMIVPRWAIWAAGVTAPGSGDAGLAGQGQAGQTSQGLSSPGREPNSRSGAVTTGTLAIQVAAQIESSLRSSPAVLSAAAGRPLRRPPGLLPTIKRIHAHCRCSALVTNCDPIPGLALPCRLGASFRDLS